MEEKIIFLIKKLKFENKYSDELNFIENKFKGISSKKYLFKKNKEKDLNDVYLLLKNLITKLFDFSKELDSLTTFSDSISFFDTESITFYTNKYLENNKYVITDGKLKIIGCRINEKMIEEELNSRIGLLMIDFENTNLSLEELITKLKDTYKSETINIKEYEDFQLEKYYGSFDFMLKRVKLANEQILKMKDNKYTNENSVLIDCLALTSDILACFSNVNFNYLDIEEQKQIYLKLEQLYIKFLSVENTLASEIEYIWKDSLTNPLEYDTSNFSFIGHVFTSGECDVDDMDKVCCSYFTNDSISIAHDYARYEYGYIFDYDIEFIDSVAFEDSGSWRVSKKEFFERGCNINVQFEQNINEDVSLFYEKCSDVYKLLLPFEMNEYSKMQNYMYNGEFLNYENMAIYNEIVMINKNKKLRPIGVFVITDEFDDYTDVIQKAKSLSERTGVPFININMTLLRKQMGLKPKQELMDKETIEKLGGKMKL
ncbi:MAG: hypothetical protein R3Y21_01815 [Mycoplasmatota bacterium]